MTDNLLPLEPERPPKPSDWLFQARQYLRRIPPGWRGTGEEIRKELRAMGLPKPASPNAWGALTRDSIERGFLMRTGKRRKMQEARSHGRMTDVYERT